ncbi:MAG: SRPBCC domain-containing protein [Pseudomonadales bacterium]|nr:SRPBCC domain-containing protein [Pseudomonadales bacterium]
MTFDTIESKFNERCLTVRRTIHARADKLFDAWTQPALLTKWWGPAHATCPSAEVDLRVGGHYKIANQMEDNTIIWISGIFEVIERPYQLVYTWLVDESEATSERVHVFFEPREDATEVIIVHEGIESQALLESHNHGWEGCLVGLINLLSNDANSTDQNQ